MHKGRIGQTKIKIKNCPVSVSETERSQSLYQK